MALTTSTSTIDPISNKTNDQKRAHTITSIPRTARSGTGLRVPLNERSQNVHMRHVQQISSRNGATFSTTEMSYDSTKTTPRVAASVPRKTKTGPYVAPRLATNSPASTSSPDLIRDARTPIRSPNASREDGATPVKNFLSSNITPRSGTRNARVNSPASTPGGTPTGTPSSSRPTSMLVTKEGGNNNGGEDTNSRVIQSKSYGKAGSAVGLGTGVYPLRGLSPERLNQSPLEGNSEESPMFFHASDAGATAPVKQSAPRAQGFVQAGGRVSGSSSILSAVEQSQPKFYHANGMPDAGVPSRPSRPTLTTAASSQRQSKLANRRVAARSTSPLKRDQTASTAQQKRSPPSNRDYNLNPSKSRSPSISTSTTDIRRASPRSYEVPPYMHKKTQSTGSIDTAPNRRRSSLVKAEPASPVNTAQLLDLPLITSPIAEVEVPDPIQESPIMSPPLLPTEPSSMSLPLLETNNSFATPTSPLVSPTRAMAPKTDPSKLDELNRLAANARRERKVLDLEISNSSLLAINRTLEREMRKQTAELRRYRRLTSAGRISLPRRSRSSRISSLNSTATASTVEDGTYFGTSSMSGSDDDDLTPLSDLDELSDENEELSEGSDSDVSLSPSARAAKDTRQRARDEKRLRMDLKQHQELLIESQRMNASLKRCLSWTEELITEGKKALAYEVQVSDVDVGGRILHADEVEVELDTRQALLSPGLEKDLGSMEWGEVRSPSSMDVQHSDNDSPRVKTVEHNTELGMKEFGQQTSDADGLEPASMQLETRNSDLRAGTGIS